MDSKAGEGFEKMKGWLFSITVLFSFLLLFYGLFNGVTVLTCLASEGNVTWNKAVFACHFDDSPSSITQQIITTSSSVDTKCLLNGQPINCSDVPAYKKERMTIK